MKSSPDNGAALERKLMKGVERLLRGLDPGLTISPMVVAVSGGPDSLALLLLLTHLKETLGLTLHVAHLDHGLRGKESVSDALFVEEVARDLDLPATLGVEDVKSYMAGRGMSLEEAAREVRYSFLSRVAARQGASAVALGHTADDQAETVLMHILRGERSNRPCGNVRAFILAFVPAQRAHSPGAPSPGCVARGDGSVLPVEGRRAQRRPDQPLA